MIRIKHIAAGLAARAMLTTSAIAHEAPAAGPYAFAKGHAGAAAASHWSGGPPHMAAPRFGESEAQPRDLPGGVCDVGDNAMIC
ncbi:hypothetical protein HAP48_0036565 [Bradyrhizobium septentrionale]|uniref:Uncharacterized protein n=1 Tax=Bradyrhizobium septentrionale TaxID=1404411 RepID=A0A974A1M4_9BRAD|nr:hypothetical protein [Bradyrhizobium septentrionale]UGY14036.1 hypothetical protein HAP48_0036565 [Bradyrhizobium septentrionale]